MATKEVKRKNDVEELDTPLKKSIDTNKRLIKQISGIEFIEEQKEVAPKKKAETKVKKLYPIYPKVALSVIFILAVGSLVGLLVYPDIKDAVYAFFEMLDPFKKFKGGNALNPSDFVMFIK